jgi:hypothetical protein
MDNPVAVVGIVAIVAMALGRPIAIKVGRWLKITSKD